jgi:hypothetical protein
LISQTEAREKLILNLFLCLVAVWIYGFFEIRRQKDEAKMNLRSNGLFVVTEGRVEVVGIDDKNSGIPHIPLIIVDLNLDIFVNGNKKSMFFLSKEQK